MKTKTLERRMSVKIDTKCYEKLRKVAFNSRKSIALVIREAIDEKLGK